MTESVILVDDLDEQVGTEEKLRVHRLGLLHRAFSVFVVNDAREILLQQRAATKYHSAGLWSNTACGHPRPDERLTLAAERRLFEEMRVACPLTMIDKFHYHVRVSDEYEENEIDHVLIGFWNGAPAPDPTEVSSWRWHAAESLDRALVERSQEFTPWLPLAWKTLKLSRALTRD